MNAIDIDVARAPRGPRPGPQRASSPGPPPSTAWPSASATPAASASAASPSAAASATWSASTASPSTTLLAAEVVTADGRHAARRRRASHPDLFWAIRGGGGNFGVVTRFKFRLHRADRVHRRHAGPPGHGGDRHTASCAAAEAAPEALSTIVNVMPAPPMPFLPPEMRGQLVVMAMLAYAGRTRRPAARAGARSARSPSRSPTSCGRCPTPSMYPPGGPELPPHRGRPQALPGPLRPADGASHRRAAASSDAAMGVAQIRVLGGAVARVPDDATAYAHRERADHGQRGRASTRARPTGSASRPPGSPLHGRRSARTTAAPTSTSSATRARRACARPIPARPGTGSRRSSGRYDPDNLFRLNQNIPPATASRAGRPQSEASGSSIPRAAPPARTAVPPPGRRRRRGCCCVRHEAREDDRAARREMPADRRRERDQRAGEDIGDDQVEGAALRGRRGAPEVRRRSRSRLGRDAVQPDILARDARRDRVDVARQHRARARAWRWRWRARPSRCRCRARSGSAGVRARRSMAMRQPAVVP